MGVEHIGSTTATTQSAQSSTYTGADLNIGDFFQLIAAELQNQSMYDTVDNAQFMSQMVQFSTLSQMSELTSAFQSNLAVSMIGKPVCVSTVNDQGAEETITGDVQQVSFSGGTPYVMVNGGLYALSEVTDVGASQTGTDAAQ